MKIINKITNGVILIILGLLHTQYAVSSFGKYFREFSESYFFKISTGADQLPAMTGKTNFESFAAFWFFYFGIFLIPMGLLLHSMEKNKKFIPHSFTISYLTVVLIGCYMVPNSGMTYFLLPHAIYMLVRNYLKRKKIRVNNL